MDNILPYFRVYEQGDACESTETLAEAHASLRKMEEAIGKDPLPAPIDQATIKRLTSADPALDTKLGEIRCLGEPCTMAAPCGECKMKRRFLHLLLHREKYGKALWPKDIADLEGSKKPPPPVGETPRILGDLGVSVSPTTSEGWKSFPLAVLPDPLRDYVDAGSQAVDCDPSYVGLPVLVTMAAAIGNSRRVELRRGWSEPSVLWGGILGESGMAKSPALDRGKDFPRKKQAEAIQRHRYELEEYQNEVMDYERALLAWKKKGGDRPQKPEVPYMVRYLVDNTTIEALAPILDKNPRGVMIAKDELGTWIGSMDRYAAKGKGGEVAQWLETHGARSILIDRATKGTIYIPRAAISIIGGIQPGILRRQIGQENRDNGLLARLLLAYPPRRPRKWTEAEPHESITQEVSRIYDTLLSLDMAIKDDGEPGPSYVSLSPEAKDRFRSFVNEHGQEQYHLDGDLAAAWSKLEGYAARLALVIHLCRWASHGVDSETIDLESMEAGITLSQWFGQEAKRIYTVLERDQETEEQEQLVDLIRRHNGTITARELAKASRRFKDSDQAELALIGLVQSLRGVWDEVPPTSKGGRPTRIFRLHMLSA